MSSGADYGRALVYQRASLRVKRGEPASYATGCRCEACLTAMREAVRDALADR